MTNEPTPETDAKLASDPHPPSDWPEYARALEIQRNAARTERDRLKEDEFLKPELDIANARLRCEVDPRDNGCLEPGVILPSQLRAERDALRADNRELKALLLLLARAIHDENWTEIGNLVPRMTAAFAAPAQ